MKFWILIGLRILGAVVTSVVLWWVGVRYLAILSSPFLLAAWVAFTGMSWFPFLGWPVLQWLGQQIGGLFMPNDDQITVRPEYSIAEARVKQGRYTEAIAAFRADIEKFPHETFPHIRIAEILLEKLQQPDAAVAELEIALNKAQSADAVVLVTFRLAEWLVKYRQDRATAITRLRAVEERFPSTAHAQAAAARRSRLET